MAELNSNQAFQEVDFSGNISQAKTKPVYQYDHGWKLKIKGLDAYYQTHFANEDMRTAVNVLGSFSGGVLTVDVPDSLLLSDEDIFCYLYDENEKSGKTVRKVFIPVYPRAKPAELVIEDPAQAEAVNQIQSQLTQALTDVNNALERVEATDGAAEESAARAEAAAKAVENMSVTYHKEDNEPTVEKKIVDGAVLLDFGLVSSRIHIQGESYASLEELKTAVPDPYVGDMYNVGAEPPYTVYRWTGTVWESQGSLGAIQGDPGFSPTIDVDEGTTTTKLTINDINGEKVVEIRNEININGVLSKDGKLDISASDIPVRPYGDESVAEALEDKVDKVDGKALSTNDFTDEMKQKLELLSFEWTNKLLYAIDYNGSIYNEKGYKDNAMWSLDDGKVVDATGWDVTGFISVMPGDVVYLANVTMVPGVVNELSPMVIGFDANMKQLANYAFSANPEPEWSAEYGGTGSLRQWTLCDVLTDQVRYIRIVAQDFNPYSIVAVNEDIAYAGNGAYLLVGDVLPFDAETGTGAGGGIATNLANNLTTTVEGYALDARQGYILDEKKVDKVEGKGLSTNDLTDELLEKIENMGGSSAGDHTHEELKWLDQDVRTTASPTFNVVTANKVYGAVYM